MRELERLREAGLFDDLIKKVAPNLAKGLEKGQIENKAKKIGEILETSNLGEHVKLPIKKTTEITNMSAKGIVKAIDGLLETLNNVLSGDTMIKFKNSAAKNEFQKIKGIIDDLKNVESYIDKVKTEIYKLHGAIEKVTEEQKENWDKADIVANQRAVRKAENEIKEHLSSIYIALFEKAFAKYHRSTDMAKPRG